MAARPCDHLLDLLPLGRAGGRVRPSSRLSALARGPGAERGFRPRCTTARVAALASFGRPRLARARQRLVIARQTLCAQWRHACAMDLEGGVSKRTRVALRVPAVLELCEGSRIRTVSGRRARSVRKPRCTRDAVSTVMLCREPNVGVHVALGDQPIKIVQRHILPIAPTVLAEGDPRKQNRVYSPLDQLLEGSALEKFAKQKPRDVGIGECTV